MARIVVGFCLLLVMGMAIVGCGTAADAASHAKWEYKVVSIGPFEGNDEATALLNKNATDGWELVAVAPRVFNNFGMDKQLNEPNAARIRTLTAFVLRRPAK